MNQKLRILEVFISHLTEVTTFVSRTMSIFSDDAKQQCTLSRLYIPDEAHDNNVSTLQSLINYLSTFVISRLTIKLLQIERTIGRSKSKICPFLCRRSEGFTLDSVSSP